MFGDDTKSPRQTLFNRTPSIFDRLSMPGTRKEEAFVAPPSRSSSSDLSRINKQNEIKLVDLKVSSINKWVTAVMDFEVSHGSFERQTILP
jgi:hypothetical protein